MASSRHFLQSTGLQRAQNQNSALGGCHPLFKFGAPACCTTFSQEMPLSTNARQQHYVTCITSSVGPGVRFVQPHLSRCCLDVELDLGRKRSFTNSCTICVSCACCCTTCASSRAMASATKGTSGAACVSQRSDESQFSPNVAGCGARASRRSRRTAAAHIGSRARAAAGMHRSLPHGFASRPASTMQQSLPLDLSNHPKRSG